ncbi:hypothetical protein QFZ73_000900 [Peribacillus sp. V2I11]|nr:hypothetical protein [Peribacillus sp. V2I11]
MKYYKVSNSGLDSKVIVAYKAGMRHSDYI